MTDSRTMCLLTILVVSLVVRYSQPLPSVIRVGAIFTEDQRDGNEELAFKYAIYRLNRERTILPNTTINYDIQYVPKEDSFRTAKTVCRQIGFGVQAIFGPTEPLLGSHVQSICDALDIPHIETRLEVESTNKELSINLHPSQDMLNAAYKDLMRFLNWTQVAIIYEEDEGLLRLQDLVRSPATKNMEVYIKQGTPATYREILKEVKRKDIYNILVDTDPSHMNAFFKAILQLQMNDYRYHFLFTSHDLETFDLEDFKYNNVNISAFRIVDAERHSTQRILKDMGKFQPVGRKILNKTNVIEAGPALMYDSVMAFAHGLAALDRGTTLNLVNLSCEAEHPWNSGSSLFNYINSVEFPGLTGPVRFKEGYRSSIKLDLLKLKREDLIKVGEWTTEAGLNISVSSAFYEGSVPNITLIVMTNEEMPYVLIRPERNLTGNDRYEGFCIDLLKHIASMVGFNYVIEIVPDRKYGALDPETGEWNGIVRQLMEKKADLAVASITINYARETVIDFTKPFMNLGISILFKEPKRSPSRLFSFMKPLAVEIWCCILLAYIMVSLCMWVVARFTPYEWRSLGCSCDADQQLTISNDFTIGNSFWFTIGTLMQQGSDLNPQAASTRIVGGIWWFFTLIIISSYTANLAAFLTVERMITPIESADDLADQNEISYGTLEGGSTMTFFRDSKIETYQKMWQYMENKRPTAFVSSYDEGYKRVLDGNFAFLMESTTLDYVVQRNCNLTQVGGLLDSKGYGIATPKGSPWRDRVSLAVLELQEKGIIQLLYNKWWKNTGDVCNRDEKNKESKASALGVENIGGVFVVLLCGLALAIVVAILEFCWNSRRNALHEQQSLCSEMGEEIRFALRCHGSRQRPKLRRNCLRCSPPNNTYVPPSHEIPPIHGENGILSIIEPRKPVQRVTYDLQD